MKNQTVNDFNLKCAKRIKELRESRNMTMEEFGKLFGVTKTSVYYWELGHNGRMKASTIQKMSEYFNVSPLWLSGMDIPYNGGDNLLNEIIEKLEKSDRQTLLKINKILDVLNGEK